MKPLFWATCLFTAILFTACAPAQYPTANPPTCVRATDAAPVPEKPITPNPNAASSTAGFGGAQYETTLGKPVTLHIRDGAVVTDTSDQFTIYFWSVPQDSRCPKTVQCVVPGDVHVNIVFAENDLMHPPIFTLVYPTQPTQRIETYLVTVTDVQPARATTDTIPQENYAATFVITQNTATPTASSSPNPTTIATPPNGLPTIQLDEPFTTCVHQTQWLPDAQMQLTINSVLEDSRCPAQVTCAWAGRAVLGLTLQQEGRLGYFRLSTMPPDAQTFVYFRGYAVKLLEVSPYPQNPGETIPDKDYRVKLVVRKQDPPTQVHKNEPLVLKPGGSAHLTDEDVTLTFERVEKDSRCPYPAMCAVQGSGVVQVTLHADGKTTPLTLDTDKQTTQRFENYAVELLALAPYPQVDQEIASEEYQATFVLRKFASPPQPTPTQSASNPNACLTITAQDAQAILGLPVQAAPAPDVKITVVVMDNFSLPGVQGVCGFVSTEKSTVPPSMPNEATIVLPHDAAYAVTAQRLDAGARAELLRVFEILRVASANADANLFHVLQTQLAAGDDAGVLKTFENLAQGADNIQVERVEGLSEAALRVWRAGQFNNYMAFLIHDGRDFILTEALAPIQMSQAALQEVFAPFAAQWAR